LLKDSFVKLKYLLVVLAIASCVHSPTVQVPGPQSTASASPLTEDERDGVHFKKLDEFVWMHTTYVNLEKWGPVFSNGLIVVGADRASLVDTAWNNEQTKTILNWTYEVLGTTISSAVFTHAHDDKMGGMEALRVAGVLTYAHPRSNVLAPLHKLTPAEFDLAILDNGSARVPGDRAATDLSKLEIYYPGAGHTEDNVVVHVKGTEILFGGCLVRPGDANSLGNTAEASISNWDDAVDRVASRFPTATVVIPSHGSPAGRELLSITSELARSAQASE